MVASDEKKVIEGSIPEGRIVVVEFPSMQHAEAFYNDPDYQPFKEIRHKYAQCDSVIVEQGFDPAS